MRLIGKINDIKEDTNFKSKNWRILFIDFRSAFDQVDQVILMKRLENSGVKERTLNILKLLYNSYHFVVKNSTPKRV